MNNMYVCAACGGTFLKGWSDDEAEAEREKLFPGVPLDACSIVCNDCFVRMGSGNIPNPTPEQRQEFRRYLSKKAEEKRK